MVAGRVWQWVVVGGRGWSCVEAQFSNSLVEFNVDNFITDYLVQEKRNDI